MKNKSDNIKHCFLPPLPFVRNFSDMEGVLNVVLELHMTNGWYLSNMVSIWFPFPCYCCVHVSVSARISIKIDAAKDCWFYNNRMHLIKNTGEGNWFSDFLLMLPKHVHVVWNFQSILKSNISFVLYFVQVV